MTELFIRTQKLSTIDLRTWHPELSEILGKYEAHTDHKGKSRTAVLSTGNRGDDNVLIVIFC